MVVAKTPSVHAPPVLPAPAPDPIPAPVVEAPKTTFDPGPAPAPAIDRGQYIPPSYALDRLVALPRDPRWIFCYWELAGGTLDRLRNELGIDAINHSAWVLRQHRIHEDVALDIEIHPSAGNWYIEVGKPGRYQFEIGLTDPKGEWHSLAATQEIETPAEWFSTNSAPVIKLETPDDQSSQPAAAPQHETAREAEEVLQNWLITEWGMSPDEVQAEDAPSIVWVESSAAGSMPFSRFRIRLPGSGSGAGIRRVMGPGFPGSSALGGSERIASGRGLGENLERAVRAAFVFGPSSGPGLPGSGEIARGSGLGLGSGVGLSSSGAVGLPSSALGASGRPFSMFAVSSSGSGAFGTMGEVGWMLAADGQHIPMLVRPYPEGDVNWNYQPNLDAYPQRGANTPPPVALPRVVKGVSRPTPGWPHVPPPGRKTWHGIGV